MSDEIILIGASGHSKVIADIIRKNGNTVYGFLDDDRTKKGVIGPVSDCLLYQDKKFVIAIGSNQIRKKIAETYPTLQYCTAIHPSAVLADNIEIGEGTVVMANAVINSDARIGNHCIINSASVVEHDCYLEDFVHISPGAVLCGTVTVKSACHIGSNAVVRNNISICDDVTIGCGGCVVKDIKSAGVYIGVPAVRTEL